MQRTSGESSLAGWSIFILSVVLVTVYIIFFSLPEKKVFSRAEGGSIKPIHETAKEMTQVQENSAHPEREIVTQKDDAVQHLQNEDEHPRTQSVKQPFIPNKSPTYIVSSQQLFNPPTEQSVGIIADEPILPQQILYLAGTHHRVGVMKSAKFIGIASSIKYILKNNDNTHFAYLGKELPDIADSLTALGGKSVAITTENDIHTHGLFGDKIIFLLVPQYIGKKQLFFVYFAEARDRWFIQVDTSIFETTKPVLRELFAKRYNR